MPSTGSSNAEKGQDQFFFTGSDLGGKLAGKFAIWRISGLEASKISYNSRFSRNFPNICRNLSENVFEAVENLA